MQKAMCNPGPDLVVCDEGHRIKNHQSNIHHALHKIRTRYVGKSFIYIEVKATFFLPPYFRPHRPPIVKKAYDFRFRIIFLGLA